MEEEKNSKNSKQSLSWEEFRKKYLDKIEQLAELFGLDEAIRRDLNICSGNEINQREIYEEWMFIDNVMTCIRDCENRDERIRLLEKLDGAEGARDIFNEIYRIWTFQKYDYCSNFRPCGGRKLGSVERRKGDLVDIFWLNDCHDGASCLSYFFEEDYAEIQHDIVVKIKHNSKMIPEQVVEALKFAAEMYERRFTNHIMQGEYLEWELQQYDAVRLGLYSASRSVYRDCEFFLYDMGVAFQLVGWIDPEVSLDSGLREMLQRGWPDLYESVLDGKMTPFEALLETGWVHPKDLFEMLGNSKEIQTLVEEKFPPYQWIHRKREIDEMIEETIMELQNI